MRALTSGHLNRTLATTSPILRHSSILLLRRVAKDLDTHRIRHIAVKGVSRPLIDLHRSLNRHDTRHHLLDILMNLHIILRPAILIITGHHMGLRSRSPTGIILLSTSKQDLR
jgi:hypothetical protein